MSGVQIGSFDISVKPDLYKRINCFKIIAKSYGVLEDVPCGTEVEAYVSENLETLDQKYHEYINLPNGKFDRKTTIFLDHDEYVIHKTETSGNVIHFIQCY